MKTSFLLLLITLLTLAAGTAPPRLYERIDKFGNCLPESEQQGNGPTQWTEQSDMDGDGTPDWKWNKEYVDSAGKKVTLRCLSKEGGQFALVYEDKIVGICPYEEGKNRAILTMDKPGGKYIETEWYARDKGEDDDEDKRADEMVYTYDVRTDKLTALNIESIPKRDETSQTNPPPLLGSGELPVAFGISQITYKNPQGPNPQRTPQPQGKHDLNITKVKGAGGAGATKWDANNRRGKAGTDYTFTATTTHNATDEHKPAAGHKVRHTFMWGDGTQTGPQNANQATHRWANPGVYYVTVSVDDEVHSGLTKTSTLTVQIENERDNNRAWVDGYVNMAAKIEMFSPRSLAVQKGRLDNVQIPVGLEGENLVEKGLKITVTLTYANGSTATAAVNSKAPRGRQSANIGVKSNVPVNVRVTRVDVTVSGWGKDRKRKDVQDINPGNGNAKYCWDDRVKSWISC